MEVSVEESGVVYDNGTVRWIDTRAMDWMPSSARGRLQKVLARNAVGEPTVYLEFIPPGPLEPFRQYHKTVRQFAYVLGGDLPFVEYPSPDADHGELVVAKQGWFLERRPRSVYGVESGMSAVAGSTILHVRDGSGTWEEDSSFSSETVQLAPAEVPGETFRAAAGADGVVLDRAGARWLVTSEVPWVPYFIGETRHHRKPLCLTDEGRETVFFHYLPPHFPLPDGLPYRHYHSTVGEFGFVLDGELPSTEYASAADLKGTALVKKRDWFMERQPRSIHGVDVGQSTPTGFMALFWTDGGFEGKWGNWIADEGHEEENVIVPFD
jgi:hypothetical protein